MVDHLAKAVSVDFSSLTRDELVLMRRHLLGVVAMIDKLLTCPLTRERQS